MKSILRARLWWPGMGPEIEKHVQACKGCAMTARQNPPVPMLRSIMPSTAWEYIALDFSGPYAVHKSVYVLSVTDYFSRYLVAAVVPTTSFEVIKAFLEALFEKFGKPKGLKSDNGPPFNSKHYEEYCKSQDMEAIFSTPLHPQQNGMAERSMQTINKAMQIVAIEGKRKPIEEALREKVRSYNSACHRVTGVAPEELMFGRKIRRGLPLLGDATASFNLEEVRTRDWQQKLGAKARDDANRHAKKTSLKAGDFVVVKALQPAKGLAKFDSKPWKIVSENNGDFELVDEDGTRTKRNVTLVKKITWEVSPRLRSTALVDSTQDGPRNNDPAKEVEPRVSTRTRTEPRHLSDYVRMIAEKQA